MLLCITEAQPCMILSRDDISQWVSKRCHPPVLFSESQVPPESLISSLNPTLVLYSLPTLFFLFYFFQLFLSFGSIHHFQFIPSIITHFQGKGAQQESHSCNFRLCGLCKRFVIASDFCNKILFSLQL